MMSSKELSEYLTMLGLGQTEAAQLLGVSDRTVRRWVDGEEVPGPVEQALRAWRRLHERNMAWRPDSVAIAEDDQQQIAASRNHAIELGGVLERVRARGGPRMHWLVDRHGCRAFLGPMEVSFYKLPNGGFSLGNYTRKDCHPDVQRDQAFIDDAAYYIAEEMKKEAVMPVTLVYLDAPGFARPAGHFGNLRHSEFASNAEALERAFLLIDQSKGHSFNIRTGTENSPGELLWTEQDLRAEYERQNKAGRFQRRL